MNANISKILVPVDFSSHSDLSLGYAASLAARLQAPMHLLHVVEPLAMTALAGEGMYLQQVVELQEALVKDAERRLRDSRAALEADGIAITTEVMTGHPAAVIVSTARDTRCDLIVMGTHGRTGLSHLFMGSVAEKVMRLAPCPVLTAREVEWKKAPASTEAKATAA